ncbi:serine hydrolase domain-containing protein [Methylosinus sporium]|uniref:serine hydrolase domain-containing protein n=1 Tax=Methylosinus sporium TaxID=428 RepID=UPI00383AE889
MRRFRFVRMAGLFPLAIGFLLAAGLSVLAEPATLDESNIAEVVDPIMKEWLDHGGAGAVVVVVDRERSLLSKGYGVADKEASRPFTADRTLVRPGSISKLFTGIAVMQLVEEGKLDLDKDVSDYAGFSIPTPPGGRPVTLRLLLTHRAGFEEHFKDLFSRSVEPMPLSAWVTKSLPLRIFPNGDVTAYSNYGMALAGYVVERVSGESFVDYVERHILAPLRMERATFRQPLPEALGPMMAKGYRGRGLPPVDYFETIAAAPAGALTATGEDMGRFMRALLSGGELDGARILPSARLEQMLTLAEPGAEVGLVFILRRLGGVDAAGHGGGTQAFFSDLELFRDKGLGVFVSRDGFSDQPQPQDIARALADRIAPREAFSAVSPADPRLAGAYQGSRRAQTNFLSVLALVGQQVIRVEADGGLTLRPAFWPFGAGRAMKPVGANVFEGSSGWRFSAVLGSEPYFNGGAQRLERASWPIDARWVVPAFAASVAFALLSLLAWPLAALWRRWRKRSSRLPAADRHRLAFVRSALLVDLLVVGALIMLAVRNDASLLNDSFDPALIAIYVLAWLGVVGAAFAVFVAVDFWRRRVGGRWTRLHQSGLAASGLIIAYVFLIFHIAGTTLNY